MSGDACDAIIHEMAGESTNKRGDPKAAPKALLMPRFKILQSRFQPDNFILKKTKAPIALAA